MHLLSAECGSSEFESGVVCVSLCLAAVPQILIHYLHSNSDPVFPESFGSGSVSEGLKYRVLHDILRVIFDVREFLTRLVLMRK